MPQFLVILACVLAIAYWEYIVITIIAIAALIGLVCFLEWLSTKSKQKRQRLEPLKDNESLRQRIETRFKQTCGDKIDGLAEIRRRRGDWRHELNPLIEKRLLPTLSDEQCAYVREIQAGNAGDPFQYIIFCRAEALQRESAEIGASVRNRYHPSHMTPREFEQWCCDMLTQQGWQANVLGGSGDQGADVIAKKDGYVLVLQCKYYNTPVGNTAVQEVYAAKTFYEASRAAVITNSTYTKGCKALANKINVDLLVADELNNIFP